MSTSTVLPTATAPTFAGTLRRAWRSAATNVRRLIAVVWTASAGMVLVQLAFDIKELSSPLVVAELVSVVLAALGMAVLASAMFLQRPGTWTRASTDEADHLASEALVVFPVLAAAGSCAIAAAIGIMVVRALLGSTAHYGIAAFMLVYLLGVGRIVLASTRALYDFGTAQAARAERAHADAIEAKMAVLQSQMTPHFLFNALNTVAALTRSDPPAAERATGDLARVLRATLERSHRPTTTLAEELEHLRAYLAVERQRFGDRLAVEWDVSRDVDRLEVPTMTLQPIVENAIRHGVQGNLSGGTIRISARDVDGALRLIVEDDGPGFARRHREGTGLGNLRSRLATLYGDAAQVRIEDPVIGARVVVDLPAPGPLDD
jgi:signal transduction histidine kinase